ncbi:MAG: hypothetical protein WBA87_15590, partial [Microbacterium sp.]
MDTSLLVIVVAVIAAALAGGLGFVLGMLRGRASDATVQAESQSARLRAESLEREAEALRAEMTARVQDERTL